MRIRNAKDNCRLLPDLRESSFARIDARYSVIDEWDMENAIIEFVPINFPMIILRLKMQRRWQVYLIKHGFIMMCLCGLALCTFSIDASEVLSQRLGYTMTLLLTTVAFSYTTFESLPNVAYLTLMDKYILAGYVYLIAIMVESCIIGLFANEYDIIFFYIALYVFIWYHSGFGYYSLYIRQEEENKLYYSSDQTEREIEITRPMLVFNYQQRVRAGDGGRLLSYFGTPKPVHDMLTAQEEAKLTLEQKKLKELFSSRAADEHIATSLDDLHS